MGDPSGSAVNFIMGRMPNTALSDEDLMLAYVQQRDMRAFTTLYDRTSLRLWRYVLRLVSDRDLANDLTQDVWGKVIKVSHYEAKAKFTTWLFTLAHNRVIDHFRASRPHLSLNADSDEGFELANTLAIDSGFGPLQQTEHREQAQALLDALAALPELQREAFLMQAEGGMSLTEIAEATDSNLETVKTRLRYARQKLRQSLEAFA